MNSNRDVIFVTIDTWRSESMDHMPWLREETDSWERGTSTAQSSSTFGSFASLLASRYYPEAYTPNGTVRDGVPTLPAVLSDQGYSTGGFIASNPYVSHWGEYFDEFWNDGLQRGDDWIDSNTTVSKIVGTADRATDFLTLKDRVSATEVADRAGKWFKNTEGPRFCWMHLMEPHEPYLPGLKHGLSEGLLSTYRSLYEFTGERKDLSPEVAETIESLYYRSVEYLDAQFELLLEFAPDDSLIVIVGDHGEEFAHGGYRHGRLYDEVLQTPLIANWTIETPDVVRHLDIPATMLHELSIPVPDPWTGESVDNAPRDTFAFNYAMSFQQVFIGHRSPQYKCIKAYDATTWEEDGVELYALNKDPGETDDIAEDRTEIKEKYIDTIDKYLASERVDLSVIHDGATAIRGESAAVQNRLEDLGYL